MGYYFFVGVRRGELFGGDLTSRSTNQIEETAGFIREFKGGYLPKVVYSDGSPEGTATAELLADLLGIGQVEVSEGFNGQSSFRTIRSFFGLIKTRVPVAPVEKMLHTLTSLENTVSNINITVCSANLLNSYLVSAYQKFGKGDIATTEDISLAPGECFISIEHEVLGIRRKKIFPSKGREDVLTEW